MWRAPSVDDPGCMLKRNESHRKRQYQTSRLTCPYEYSRCTRLRVHLIQRKYVYMPMTRVWYICWILRRHIPPVFQVIRDDSLDQQSQHRGPSLILSDLRHALVPPRRLVCHGYNDGNHYCNFKPGVSSGLIYWRSAISTI
jgi:hypothetical protein